MKTPAAPSDKAIAALLAQYKCPTPFAAVRTIFMGNIASPILRVSPLATLETLWEGQMLAFETGEDVQALFDVLIGGLWHCLTEHQSSRHPFQLVRAPVAVTRQGLGTLATLRQQEIAGFMDGLFGKEEELHLPEKAHQAIPSLSQVHAMFVGAATMLADETTPASDQHLAEFARNAQEMTAIAQVQINKVILACKRARDGHPEPMATAPTSRHVFHREEDELPFADSPLSRQQFTRNGITVQVNIFEDGQGKWLLEVVDQQNTSHVWDAPFDTDHEALAEAIRALEEEPMEFLTVPASPRDVH